jgi:hypothetical protein
MRKRPGGSTAGLTMSVLVALLLVVGVPQRADAAVVYYGISESSASWWEGSNKFTFHWRLSVAKDTSTGKVRYRAHLWCTRNGSNSPCNFRNDGAWLFYKNCAPSNFSLACERTIDAWGPRDFPGCPTYCNVSHAYPDSTDDLIVSGDLARVGRPGRAGNGLRWVSGRAVLCPLARVAPASSAGWLSGQADTRPVGPNATTPRRPPGRVGQVGWGMQRSRARANWKRHRHGQRAGRCRMGRRAETASRAGSAR